MTRPMAAFLDLTTPGGLVARRWQTYWLDPVTFETATWEPLDFGWSQIGSALLGADVAVLDFPGLPSLHSSLALAARELWVGRVRVFGWTQAQDGPTPPAGMVLLGAANGRVELREVTVPSLSIALTSAASTAGQQSGAVIASNASIGNPVEMPL